MIGKKTKGKQKITIRKVEKLEDRMVTFSKRRTGIYTKLTELSILCGSDVAFLVYSGAGKPYTFGSPSFEAVAERFLNGNQPVNNGEGLTSPSSIVEAHKKVKLDELCKTFNKLMEETAEEEEKAKTSAAAIEPSLPVEIDEWWTVEPKNNEEAMQLLRRYEEFYGKLCEAAAVRISGGDAAPSTSTFPQVTLPQVKLTGNYYSRLG
ncbi:unnamed protein product [Thlaspi arvense]|uniref:MADS-box domain-containing protein n=1 Tax=Thlaspi arvense TaxID=13288 RepID=A0AAU9R6D3_THLAR|nr:unnamed protein product [Thlaspi arvense]